MVYEARLTAADLQLEYELYPPSGNPDYYKAYWAWLDALKLERQDEVYRVIEMTENMPGCRFLITSKDRNLLTLIYQAYVQKMERLFEYQRPVEELVSFVEGGGFLKFKNGSELALADLDSETKCNSRYYGVFDLDATS